MPARVNGMKKKVTTEASPLQPHAENSPPHFGASNDRPAPWSIHLAQACHAAALSAGGAEVVLGHFREAAGAERAFLIEACPPPATSRALAISTTRNDGSVEFSTQVAARALRSERPLVLSDIRREPLWADGLSVRSLKLRWAVTASLPVIDGRRTAILADSRGPLVVDPAEGPKMAAAFAALAWLTHRGVPSPQASARGRSTLPVGRSAAFLALQHQVRSAARVPLPVLVVGESGSGKELVARGLHEAGPRAGRPFVAVNCAAIPEALLERELFGAMRGAFTGADRDHPGLFRQADGGTLFLDEIGDLSLLLQAKLLRVLQEGTVRAVGALEERPVDVRLVAATHRDLEALVAENRFRADLRWRLEVLLLHVPPLRERLGDLPVLCESLIERLAARCGFAPARLAAEATARLSAHCWPGNVRELESVLARALMRATGGVIRPDDVDIAAVSPEPDARGPAPLARSLERAMIEEALGASRGNMTAAALRIGWSRQALYRRMHALGLGSDRHKPKRTTRQDSSGPVGTRSSDNSTFQ